MSVIEKLLSEIARHLDDQEIPYMIIGGQAVLVYGSPRLTRDIGISLGIDTDKFSLIEDICTKTSLKMLPAQPEDFAKETKVLPAEDMASHVRVDFIFSFTQYEMQAMSNTRPVKMEGYPIRFASPEDVIIHKMIAGRAVDEEDVKNILLKQRGKIDQGYIEGWLSQFDEIPEHKGVTGRLKDLLKRIE